MLLANMPDDHVTTVSILSENVPLDEMFFNEIISFTDHNFANEKILNGIVMAINRDIDFKGFCQLIKNLVKRECRFSKEMLQLEIGNVYIAKLRMLCMYICTYNMYTHSYIHNIVISTYVSTCFCYMQNALILKRRQ